jgi:hypothetical protein
MSTDRRSFIKSTVAGAAGLSLAGPVSSSLASAPQGLIWTDKMPINPDISNMRVVCMHDPAMCKDTTSNTFASVNQAVDEKKVSANLDEMAMQLTKKTNAADAWKTIFRSGKPWADTKVMIKVNAVEKKMLARVAVIKKIADVLIGYGVQPKNIVLFDGQGSAWAEYTNFISLTDTTKIRAVLSNKYDSMGGSANVTIPDVPAGVGPADLVNGITDIIVNIAVNKGHDSPTFHVGMTTLCLKNHYGTFLRKAAGMADHLHSTAGLINSNKIASIVGGTPVRQQLCIIDSLWAMKGGPSGSPTHKPDSLVMGTFAGAVDYYCAKKIREAVMGVTNHEAAVIDKFLTGFGYKTTDPEYVEITPTSVIAGKVNQPAETIDFTHAHSSMHRSTIRFSLPAGTRQPLHTRILDMRGGLVREIVSPAGTNMVVWDGRAANGGIAGAGNYIVDISAGLSRATEQMTLIR